MKARSGGKTEEVLNAIKYYFDEHAYVPSIREIGDLTGLRSTSSVHVHMDKLFRLGVIETDLEHDETATNGSPRAYRLKGNSKKSRDTREKEYQDAIDKINEYKDTINQLREVLSTIPEELSESEQILIISKIVNSVKEP